MNRKYHLISKIVPIEKLLDRLGYDRNEQGFMSCPFHLDKTPSLKVYGGESGWYCFSCSRGGGSIEFLAQLRSISKLQAVKILENSFRLHLEGFKERSRLHRLRQKSQYDIEKETCDQWERDLCQKIVPFIFSIPDGPVREILYTAWYDHCCNLLDRARYFVHMSGSLQPLKGVLEEITDFLTWTIDMYMEDHDIPERVGSTGYSLCSKIDPFEGDQGD